MSAIKSDEVTSCKHNCPHKYKAHTEPPKRICTVINREILKKDLEGINSIGKIYPKPFPVWCPLKEGLDG